MGLSELMHGAAQILARLEDSNGNPIARQIPHIYEFMPNGQPLTPSFVLHPDETTQEYPHQAMQERFEYDFYADLYFAQGDSLSNVDATLRPYETIVMETINHHIQLNNGPPNGACLNSAVTRAQYGGFNWPPGSDSGAHFLGIRFTIHAVEMKQFVYRA